MRGKAGDSEGDRNRRFKLEEAVLLGTILPLQCFLSKPVAFSEAAQVDGLSVGQILPGHINLVKEQEIFKKKRVVWQGGGRNTTEDSRGDV